MPLTLEGITVQAPDDAARRLLHDVNLDLGGGTVTLLVGRTGSGKSTLLQVLAGIRPPSSGTVRLDGKPIWRRKRVSRSDLLRLGATFQFPEQQLFARTVAGEFHYSLAPFELDPTVRQQRIQEASRYFDRQGTLFEPDRSPFSLSGGEQRRLALAASFAAGGDWLLMDEPTAGLESAASADLLQLIRERKTASAAGGTVIATHDLDMFLPLADRVIVLNEGRVAADAPPEQICEDERIWVQAGVGLPSCIEVAGALARVGLSLPRGLMDTDEVAQAIDDRLKDTAEIEAEAGMEARTEAKAGTEAGMAVKVEAGTEAETETETESEAETETESEAGAESDRQGKAIVPSQRDNEVAAVRQVKEAVTVRKIEEAATTGQDAECLHPSSASDRQPAASETIANPGWQRLDPRAKWLVYMIYLIVTMLQHTWIGLAAAALPLCLSFAGLPRPVLRGGYRFARPFLLFAVISILLSGFAGFGGEGLLPIQFEPQQALATGFNLTRLLLITMASYWLSSVTPHGTMIQALYWAMKPAKRIKVPVETIALATTLLFRFLPLVLSEFQRFSTIVRARGKVSRPPGSVRFRDLPALVIPLMLSLLYKAEALTTGLEMRKTRGRLLHIRSDFLKWTRTETRFTAASLLIFALLLLLA